MDAELNAQIYLLEAELYLEQGDINSAADAAAQAVKLDESSNVLRKAAVTAYQAGNEERIGTVKNQWYRQALAYYEMLCQKTIRHMRIVWEGRFFFEFSENIETVRMCWKR